MNMMRAPVLAALMIAGLLGSASVAGARSTGSNLNSGETGGSFPGEMVCTRCHAGSELNSGTGTLQLLIDGASAADHTYTPGETVTLVVQFMDSTVSRSGFQLTARSGDGCGQPGTLADGTPEGTTSTISILEGTCGTGMIQRATHRRPTNGTSATWNVSWTAPAESAGPVTVAVAVNGANGDQARTGDKIYNVIATIQPAAVEVPAPSISENGVILGDRASMTAALAPGAIAVAQGANLSKDGATVAGTVDDAGLVTTNLGGTCVEVNQTKAPVIRLANEEVIFQVPFGTGLGTTSVQVVRDCGEMVEQRSNSASVTAEAVKPVFYLFSDSTLGIVAITTDGELVGAADAIEGVTTKPANPGDIVTVFGTGFGSTSPALGTGEIAVAPAPLASSSARPMIGEMEVADTDLIYVGAAPNFAGLYQMSFKIPDNTPAGQHAFSVMLDSVTSPEGPKLEIAVPETSMMDDGEVQQCMVGLTLKAGESCQTVISGLTATFEVKEDGEACAGAGALEFCHSAGNLVSTLILFGADAEQHDDGSWTITKLP